MVYINAEDGGSFSFTPASSVFFAVKETGLIMEEVCSNCEYFTQVSITSREYRWGHCREPSMKERSIDKKDVFKWADGTCTDFKPKQEAEKTGRCI